MLIHGLGRSFQDTGETVFSKKSTKGIVIQINLVLKIYRH